VHYAVAFSVQSLEFAPRQGQFLLETAMYDVRYAGMTDCECWERRGGEWRENRESYVASSILRAVSFKWRYFINQM